MGAQDENRRGAKRVQPTCRTCGGVLHLVVRAGPEAPVVAGICSDCAYIVVPYRGVGVTRAVRDWLEGQDVGRTG